MRNIDFYSEMRFQKVQKCDDNYGQHWQSCNHVSHRFFITLSSSGERAVEQGEGDEREDKKVEELKHTFFSVTGTIRKHHTYRPLEVEVIGNKALLFSCLG